MKRNSLLGELLAEFLGTLILVLLGEGVVLQVLAGGKGSADAINWGWGLAVVMGMYVAGGGSGAHLNPAVTLALAVRRAFPPLKVLPYVLAQVLGAFCAAGILFFTTNATIVAYETAKNIVRSDLTATTGTADTASTAGFWAIYPAVGSGFWAGALEQAIGAALLVAVILAIRDRRNQAVRGNLAPLIVGLLVVVLGMAMSAGAGYAVNPARDLGPRLLSALGGWGTNPFTYSESGSGLPFFLAPLLAPLVGGVLGALVYDFGIRHFLMAQGEREVPVEERGTTVLDRAGAEPAHHEHGGAHADPPPGSAHHEHGSAHADLPPGSAKHR